MIVERGAHRRQVPMVTGLALLVALAGAACQKKADLSGAGRELVFRCQDCRLRRRAPGSPFTNDVHNGYKAAEADLGPSVTYYFSDWNPQTFVSQFREALAPQTGRHRDDGRSS